MKKMISLCGTLLTLSTVAHAQSEPDTTLLSCELSKVKPESLNNPRAPISDFEKIPFSISFASKTKPRSEGGSFEIDSRTIKVNDPKNLLLSAKLDIGFYTSDRQMLFFGGKVKPGLDVVVPVPQSSKDPAIWNGGIMLEGKVSKKQRMNHVYLGACRLKTSADEGKI
jgi:hypothetical protein